MRCAIRLFSLLLLALASACGPPVEKIDIVLLILDAAPAGGAATLPGFDEYARRGTSFDLAYTVSGEIEPALRTVLSGRFPSGPPSDLSLPRLLSASGRATLALDTRPGGGAAAWANAFDEALDTSAATETATRLGDALARETPLFAVIRLGGAGRASGEQLGRIASLLDDATTAWVLTAAVGDPRAAGLGEPRIRVPLFVHRPGEAPAWEERPVQLVDLFPSVLSWAGVATEPYPSQGVDLAATRSAIFCERDTLRSLRRGRFKIIAGDGSAPRLHDLTTDPDEAHDRASEPDWGPVRNELLQGLEDMAAWIAEEEAPAPEEAGALDAATLEELRSLGYLQ